ncbi:MAG TPA: flagella basal body P-ring formation protein FlgA [Terracidiphilus sp.]
MQNQSDAVTQYRAVRLIEDPSTHLCWMLLKDANHPARPARLQRVTRNAGSAPDSIGVRPSPQTPVIRAGDLLTVSKHAAVSEVQVEAMALGSAAVGDVLRVRLRSSGRVLSVIADGPGRATIFTDRNGVSW